MCKNSKSKGKEIILYLNSLLLGIKESCWSTQAYQRKVWVVEVGGCMERSVEGHGRDEGGCGEEEKLVKC